jgi:large subunit ribosomal protein L9
MKVFLRKDVEKVGMAGEIVKVEPGFARNYLFPRELAVEVTAENEQFFQKRVKKIEHRKEVIESKTSMLAENIKALRLILQRKMHDDGKLYGAVNEKEIAELLAKAGYSIDKNKIIIDKSIKSKGEYQVTVKLTNSLQPKVTIAVIPETKA